jgi:hypothetical protein
MTLTEVEAALVEWHAALLAVSKNQSYSINGRALTRASAAEIRETIDWLEGKKVDLMAAASGTGRVRYVSG